MASWKCPRCRWFFALKLWFTLVDQEPLESSGRFYWMFTSSLMGLNQRSISPCLQVISPACWTGKSWNTIWAVLPLNKNYQRLQQKVRWWPDVTSEREQFIPSCLVDLCRFYLLICCIPSGVITHGKLVHPKKPTGMCLSRLENYTKIGP